jgi:hypothetical protein
MSYTNGLDKPTDYFNTKLYTGNYNTNAITGVGFQPDWVWIKERSSTSDHSLHDSVRGSTKIIKSSTTDAEITRTGSITSFDSDGFTLGQNNGVNENSQTYASWNWLAGGSASSNSDGSITSSVSANTTAGFSIVSYTGNGSTGTIGHGLNSTPKVIIFKDRTNTNGWHFYHGSFGATDLLLLDATNSLLTGNSYMNSTLPTSSLISLGNSGGVNGSSANYIAYCFAEKKGYSKFGSYTGNGNSDGTFVYTGFKPAWIMIKRTDASGHYWHIYDNKREPFNPVGKVLYPNRSDSEFAGSNRPDLLSNGFKNRSGNTDINASGGNYIYMAFAENPFVTGASAIPTTAR